MLKWSQSNSFIELLSTVTSEHRLEKRQKSVSRLDLWPNMCQFVFVISSGRKRVHLKTTYQCKSYVSFKNCSQLHNIYVSAGMHECWSPVVSLFKMLKLVCFNIWPWWFPSLKPELWYSSEPQCYYCRPD